MKARHAVPRPAPSRVGQVLLVLATVCGIWFGVTAPDVSPAAPPVVPAVDGGPAGTDPQPGGSP